MNDAEVAEEYECPQEGCGRDCTHVEEGYYECRCGWFGQRISKIDDLQAENGRLRKRNAWLEEVVALAQEHELLDLGNSNEWPQWEDQ